MSIAPLHRESLGQGPGLVMVHGWGMHAGVWAETAQRLAAGFRVTLVDLPGCGGTPLEEGEADYDCGRLAARLAEASPPGAACLGWSLGGMLALRAAADHPGRFRRLVLIGASPRFVSGPGWPAAVAPELLERFAAELEGDWRATLSRFLALQTRGAERAGETLRLLRSRLLDGGEPALAALRGGLRILAGEDLRPRLAGLSLPTLFLLGERDTLVPAAAAEAAAAMTAAGRVRLIPGAGHAPFLSHPEPFAEALRAFLHE